MFVQYHILQYSDVHIILCTHIGYTTPTRRFSGYTPRVAQPGVVYH